MSLDTVELVIRCEQRFGITIADAEAAQAETVGSLFELICKHRGLPYGEEQIRPVTHVLVPAFASLPEHANRDEIWAHLVEIVAEQLQVEAYEVTYNAHWSRDLGAN